jgi:hypothetical protein
MNIDEIWIGQLLVLKKLEEIPDEVSDNMKPWCGRVVKVASIEKNEPADDIVIIRLEECPDEEWYVEDFERESPYQNAVQGLDNTKPLAYPFYTPSEKSVYTSPCVQDGLVTKSPLAPNVVYEKSKMNTANFVPPSWYGQPKKINPNKAFKEKKCGAPKKTWKITEMGTATGRINPCGEIGIHEEKRVIEFNKEKKEYEYVTFEMSSEQLNSKPQATYTVTKGLDGKITIEQD